jgi:hypothetical protein
MTTINPAFLLTAEDLALLSDEQFENLRGTADQMYRLVLAEKRRRRDEAASRYEVLGKDTTATCLRHRRLVRWMAAPCWWYHDAPIDPQPAETRKCTAMLEAPAPLVLVDRATGTVHGTGYLPPMVKLANRLVTAKTESRPPVSSSPATPEEGVSP